MLRYWLRYVPLMRSLLAFLAGVFSTEYFVVVPQISILMGLLLLTVILFYFRSPSFRYAWIPGSSIVIFFFLFGNTYAKSWLEEPCCPAADEVVVSGYVIDRVGFTAKSQKVEFFADTIFHGDTLYFNRKGVVYLSNALDSVPLPGRRLAFTIRLMPLQPPDNPGMFDYSQYLLRSGFSFMGYVVPRSVEILPGQRWTLAVMVAEMKNAMERSFLKSGVAAEYIGLLQSFFVGDKSELDQDVKQAFMDSGTMHLLAVSGMHVAIIYVLLIHIFPPFKVKGWRFIRFAAIIILLWLYGLLTGMSPSVLRAIIMMTVIETGRTFGQQASILNLMVVAMFVTLLINPLWAYSAGMWLSFSAVAGIVFVYPRLNSLFTFRFPAFRWIWSLMAVSIASQIGTLPFSLYYFHAFPVYFLLNNLVLVPLVTPVLMFALLILFTSWFPLLATIFSGSLNDLLWLNGRYVLYAGQLPHSVWKYIPFDGFDLLMSSALLIILYLFLSRRDYRIWIYGLMIAVLMLSKLLFYNQWYCTKTELTVFNTPFKLMMAVATPGQTLLLVSENVTDSDIGYVASGYLSTPGMASARIITAHHPMTFDVGGITVGVLMGGNPLEGWEQPLGEADVIVVGSDVWLPDDAVPIAAQQVVLSSSLRPFVLKRWHLLSSNAGFRLHDVSEDGAFLLKIKP